jgi:hypothetical protein
MAEPMASAESPELRHNIPDFTMPRRNGVVAYKLPRSLCDTERTKNFMRVYGLRDQSGQQ